VQPRPTLHEPGASAFASSPTGSFFDRLRRREPAAVEEMHTRHSARLRRYIATILTNREDRADVLQETFARAIKSLPQYEARGQPLERWLSAIAKNCALSRRGQVARSQATEPAVLSRAQDEQGSFDLGDELSRSWSTPMLNALRSLPRGQRDVVILRHVGDLDYERIGALLECAPSAVRKRESRALAELRARFERPPG
jgi:RNA polymerase sigma-70 factor, ECF subfamily